MGRRFVGVSGWAVQPSVGRTAQRDRLLMGLLIATMGTPEEMLSWPSARSFDQAKTIS
jgi:hypothetical protein